MTSISGFIVYFFKASRRGRREAVARDFLTGAAHDFFKKDSRKMAPVATAANAAAGGDAIDGHFNADDDDDDDDDEVDGVFSKTVSRETLLEAERLVLSGKGPFVSRMPCNTSKRIPCFLTYLREDFFIENNQFNH